MTKFKVYRLNTSGIVTVEIIEAYDWPTLINSIIYIGASVFKIMVIGGPEPIEDET